MENESRAIDPPINVTPIPPEEMERRGWKITLDGTVDNPSFLRLANPNIGVKVEYGKTPAGYDGLAIEEQGGGGALTLPFVKIDGEIYVGLLEEDRPYQGGMVLNAPRGFLDPGETHFQTARRELLEESGYKSPTSRLKAMEGDNINPNSTYFVTKGKDKGVRPFKLQVLPQEVRPSLMTSSKIDRIYEFDPAVLSAQSKSAEKIMKCKFHHWSKATRIQDGMTLTALSRFIPEEVIPDIEQKRERHRLIAVLRKIMGKKS